MDDPNVPDDTIVYTNEEGVGFTKKQISTLRRSAATQGTHFRNACETARRTCLTAKEEPGPYTLAAVQRAQKAAENQWYKVVEKRLLLIEADRTREADHRKEYNSLQDAWNLVDNLINEALAACQRQVAEERERTNKANANVEAARASDMVTVQVDHARPSKLHSGAQYYEYKQWKEKFRFYYTASRIDRAPLHVKHGTLMNCIDGKLWMRIHSKIAGKDIYNEADVTDPKGTVIELLKRRV